LLPVERYVGLETRRSIALVWLESSGSWASAVVISETGLLITCAHFLMGRSWMEMSASSESEKQKVQSAPKSCRCRVHVRRGNDTFEEASFNARVLHVFEGAFDVALLQADIAEGNKAAVRPRFAPMSWRHAAMEGACVCAVGFGLFGPWAPWRGPSVSVGHVSRIAFGSTKHRAAVMQSSAAVHRGCSGGALVQIRGTEPELVGLVTTNVKQEDGTTMPHLNFSLPMSLLPPLPDYFHSQAASSIALTDPRLRELVEAWKVCMADDEEQGLWRLEPEDLYLPSPVEARKQLALDKLKQLEEEASRIERESAAGEPPAQQQEQQLRAKL